MAIAYGTQRTMILSSWHWRYSPKGWESVFRPVSDTCTKIDDTVPKLWTGEKNIQDAPLVYLPPVEYLEARPPYLPLSFPEDLAGEYANCTYMWAF